MTSTSDILVDTSGSMAEEGKKSVVRYLLYAIESLLSEEWTGRDYRIYLYGDEIRPYGSKSAKIEFSGRGNAERLKDFLSDRQGSTVLLISDGGYPEEVKRVFVNSGARFLVLMVGCDCNKAVLQKIAGAENLFEASDAAACISQFMN